jgi:hypothetical protein
MLEAYIEEFFGVLAAVLPENWRKVVFYGKLGEGSYEFYHFILQENSSEYVDADDLCDARILSRRDVIKAYSKLFDICRKALAQADTPWTGVILRVDSNGHFSLDYSYGEQSLGVSIEWMRENLIP